MLEFFIFVWGDWRFPAHESLHVHIIVFNILSQKSFSWPTKRTCFTTVALQGPVYLALLFATKKNEEEQNSIIITPEALESSILSTAGRLGYGGGRH